MSPSLPRLHRVVVLVVVGVVLALALVLTVLAGTRDRPDPERPRPAATARPTSAPADEPVAGTALRRLRLEDLPAGPPPRIGYADRPSYVAPDGTRTRLRTPHGLSGLVPWRDGFLAADTRWFEGTLGLTLRDGTGRLVQEWPSAGHPVGTRDGRVAWTRVTVSEATNPGRARVFVGAPDGTVRVQTVEPGIIAVVGFSGDRVVFERYRGHGIYLTDLESPPMRLRWTPRRPGPVSPDGARMVSYAGAALRVHRLSDGAVLRRLDPPQGWVTSLAWEDARHLLAVVQQRQRSAVVRLSLTGRIERVTPVRRARGSQAPYVLATRP